MERYQIWCDIESGSKYISLDVKDPPFRWRFKFEDGLEAQATLLLSGGKNALINIDCTTAAPDIEILIQSTVRHAQSLYDAALFHCGISGIIIPRSAILPDGKIANLLFNDVSRLIDYDALGLSIEQITHCSILSEIVKMCLSDLRNGALNMRDAGMLCYRAIETIMQDYKESTDEESKSTWPKVRGSLRFEKSFVDPVTQYSIPNRHGQPVYLDTEAVRDIMRRALILVGRYSRVKVLRINIDHEEILK